MSRLRAPGQNSLKNGIPPLPFPLPALLKQHYYIKRGARVRVGGHPPFYATLRFTHKHGLIPKAAMVMRVKHRWNVSHNYLAGITADAWWRLLRENHFAVDPVYW